MEFYRKNMQNAIVWNSFGFEDAARSHFLFPGFVLGVGALTDNKDFGLVTVLRGGVPKAITGLA